MIIHRVIRTVRRFQGWVGGGAAVCLMVGLYLGLIGSPPDYYQGEVVRIMYIHVPLAHTSLLGYLALAVGSAWYLWKRDPLADNVCHAVAALSAAFTALALATGMIWGKPTWNTWWTWDARLTSYTVMLFILIGYLMLRTVIDDPEKEARYAAVLALIGLVDLPIIHFFRGMVADPASTAIHLSARRQYFLRLVGAPGMHEHRHVLAVLLHADGPHPAVVSDPLASREKRTALESVSPVEIRYMTNFYVRWSGILMAALALSAFTYHHYQQNLATWSPSQVKARTPLSEVRVLGMVQGGTLAGRVEAGEAAFELIEGDAALPEHTGIPVRYHGPPSGKSARTQDPGRDREMECFRQYVRGPRDWIGDELRFCRKRVPDRPDSIGPVSLTMSRRVSLLYEEIKTSTLYREEDPREQ